jgi:hypothetical protein
MSFGKFIAFYAKECGRELWKSRRWTKISGASLDRTAEGGCPYINLHVARTKAIFPFRTCPAGICLVHFWLSTLKSWAAMPMLLRQGPFLLYVGKPLSFQAFQRKASDCWSPR